MKNVRQSEVAKQAGVSLATVSRVLNQSGYVAEEARIRVEKAIAELGYVPTTHSFCQRQKIIGIILPYGRFNPYFEKLELCLHQACKCIGFGTFFVKEEHITNETLVPLVKELTALQVCGIIIATFNDNNLEPSTRDTLTACNIPVVFIERTAGCYGFNRVCVENKIGTYMAANHLIETGHTQLLYVTKTIKSETEKARLNGFLDAVSEFNGQINGMVRHCNEYSPKAACEEVKNAFLENPSITGIITWNDTYSLGALLYVTQQCKHVPADIEIIGYDDVLASVLEPPISSVHMPIEEMASAAVEILAKNYNSRNPLSIRTVLLEPKLILR